MDRNTYGRLLVRTAALLAISAALSVEAVKVRRPQGTIGYLAGTNRTVRTVRAEKPTTSADLLKDMRDEDVFVQVGDDDKVTWGMLHGYIDASLNMKIASLFAAAPSDQMGGVRLGLYQQALTKTLRRYLGAAVVAHEARKAGLEVPTADFDAKVAELKKKSPNPSPFQYRFLTNAVYQQAYVEKNIRPSLEVPEAAVTNLVARRHAENLSVPATNVLLLAKIEDIRAKLLNGELSFAEVAEEESDCADCCSNGGDCGTWEEDLDGIATNLLNVCFSLPTNTLSEVVETPEAFHLVKIVSRYVPTKKARDEDGEVSSVDVRHIQVDKWMPEPEFTRETARKFIEDRLLKQVLAAKQYELLDKTPIKSVIPVKGKGDNRKAEKVRRILETARRNNFK